jgi:hypothetical protein
MSSRKWTTVARVATLLIPVGAIVDLAGWKPGIFLAAAACLVLLLTLHEP